MATTQCYLFIIVSLVLLIGGMFGGILDFCNRFSISAPKSVNDELLYSSILYSGSRLSRRDLTYIAFTHVLLGIGGASAVALFMLSLGRLSISLEPKELMFNLTLAVVSGFGGSRFLEKVRNKLEKQIDETRGEVTAIKGELSRVKKEVQDDLLVNDILNNAYAILEGAGSKGHSEIVEVSKNLQEILRHPKEYDRLILRRAAIFSGRIFRHKFDDLERGIDSLTIFANMPNNNRDEHLAIVLYNRACYNCKLYELNQNNENLIRAVDKDLKEAIEISPQLKEDIFGQNPDEDLDAYRNWINQNVK